MENKNLNKYFNEFYEMYKSLSLEELSEVAFATKDEEIRLFLGMLINYSLEVNFKKASELEKY